MNYEAAARRAAKKYGIDPDVFVAQLRQESGLNPNARSPAGAQGIAQFIPSTAKAYGVNLNDGKVADDLDGAARYMKDNLKRTGGNYTKALSIYNSGDPNGYTHIAETANYVKTILNGRTPAKSAEPSSPRASTPAGRGSTGATPVQGQNLDLLKSILQKRGRGRLASLLPQQQESEPADSLPAGTTDSPAPSGGGASGRTSGRKGNNTDIVALAKLAESLGLRVGELEGYKGEHAAPGVHTATSNHYARARGGTGAAADISGDPARMAQFAKIVDANFGGDVEELIYRGPGSNGGKFNRKNGKRVPGSFYQNHTDHVHVADRD